MIFQAVTGCTDLAERFPPVVHVAGQLQRRLIGFDDLVPFAGAAAGEQFGGLFFQVLIPALAEQLQHLGIKRAGLCGDNAIALVLADLACLMADVVCVPVPMFFSNRQIAHLTERAGLECLLFSGQTEQAEHIGQGVWLRHLPVSAAHPG